MKGKLLTFIWELDIQSRMPGLISAEFIKNVPSMYSEFRVHDYFLELFATIYISISNQCNKTEQVNCVNNTWIEDNGTYSIYPVAY